MLREIDYQSLRGHPRGVRLRTVCSVAAHGSADIWRRVASIASITNVSFSDYKFEPCADYVVRAEERSRLSRKEARRDCS